MRELISPRQESLAPDPLIFRICPIQQIPKMSRYIRPDAFSNSSHHEAIKCVWLPQYEEAKVFVQYFIDNITYRHHVIHTPSLWAMIDDVYVHLNSQAKIKPGRVALLLSILASATSLWTALDADTTAFPTVAETRDLTSLWIKAAEDVLDYAHRTTLVSLEVIQSMVIMSFVIVNLEGLAQRHRNMISTVCEILSGRCRSLHMVWDVQRGFASLPDPGQPLVQSSRMATSDANGLYRLQRWLVSWASIGSTIRTTERKPSWQGWHRWTQCKQK